MKGQGFRVKKRLEGVKQAIAAARQALNGEVFEIRATYPLLAYDNEFCYDVWWTTDDDMQFKSAQTVQDTCDFKKGYYLIRRLK